MQPVFSAAMEGGDTDKDGQGNQSPAFILRPMHGRRAQKRDNKRGECTRKNNGFRKPDGELKGIRERNGGKNLLGGRRNPKEMSGRLQILKSVVVEKKNRKRGP